MSLLDNLPHLATARLRRRTKDSAGGSKDTYPTVVFSNRACWRQPASDRQVAYWQQKSIEVTHNVYFASNPGVDERHVLDIGGERHAVISVSDPDASCGLGVCWKVLVELLGSAT